MTLGLCMCLSLCLDCLQSRLAPACHRAVKLNHRLGIFPLHDGAVGARDWPRIDGNVFWITERKMDGGPKVHGQGQQANRERIRTSTMGRFAVIVGVYYPERGNCTLCHPQVLNGNYQVKLPKWDGVTKRPFRDEGWQLDVDGVGVKACPPGVGGAVSPFGAVVRSTMTAGIGFACLTNGSPAATVASERASSVNNGAEDGDAYGASSCEFTEDGVNTYWENKRWSIHALRRGAGATSCFSSAVCWFSNKTTHAGRRRKKKSLWLSMGKINSSCVLFVTLSVLYKVKSWTKQKHMLSLPQIKATLRCLSSLKW